MTNKIKKIEWEKTFNDPQNFNAKGINRIYDAYGPTPVGAFRICSVTTGDVTTNFIWESPLTKNFSVYTDSLESALRKCETNYETAVLRALETEDDNDNVEIRIYDN